MKILLSAYACEPGKGSEPEVGFRTMLAAAERHSVWVLTRQNNVDAVAAFLDGHPLRSRITVVGFDLGAYHLRLKRLIGRFGTIWYYDRWQKAVTAVAAQLDQENDFDLAHHITFAAYWGRLGVAGLKKPLVVGPVGGAATSPLRLLPTLGVVGVGSEMVKRFARPAAARLTGSLRAQRRAALIFAQNHEAAKAIGAPDRTRILPNGLIGAAQSEAKEAERSPNPRFIFAGRLVGWKGPLLAIRALARYPSETATLEIYGSGRLQRQLRKEAERLHVADRVVLQGPVPRDALLHRIRTSTALIHPALHDDSPLTVAEALSVGTPIVCIDRAGPPIISSYWPNTPSRAVPASDPRGTAKELAKALAEVAGQSGVPDSSPARHLLDVILDAYDQIAAPSADAE